MQCPHKHVDAADDGPRPTLKYWRSLEELAGSPEFEQRVRREFPHLASEWKDEVSRRRFLSLMAASLALAGIGTGGCVRKREGIEPYVVQPERVVPGRPLYFATAMPGPGGWGLGLLTESHEGRPTKVEGNPDHPASLGATNLFAQASVLSLYDPDRSRTVTNAGEVRTWAQFVGMLGPVVGELKAKRGAGLRILTETVTSPTLAALIHRLTNEMPEAKWHQWEPISHDAAMEGARRAFGRSVDVVYHFDRADRVVSLDADFLGCGAGSVRYGRDFAKRRKGNAEPNRLYAVVSTPTGTGAVADLRMTVPAGRVAGIARELREALRALSAGGQIAQPGDSFAARAAEDLWAHRGRCVVVPGECQPADVHVLAHAMNDMLGASGQTVTYVDPVDAAAVDQLESITRLVKDLRSGEVSCLVILGANPVYTAPADLDFAGAMAGSKAMKIHHSHSFDETSYHCDWHVPEAHYLESWGDVRAFEGTVSVVQPLILPLFEAWTPGQVVAALWGEQEADPREQVRQHWRAFYQGNDFERFWMAALQKGLIEGTAARPVQVRMRPDALAAAQTPESASGLEVQFRADPTIYDGRFANNGWLQELPKPISHLVWDNAAVFSPATAKEHGIADGDVVRLRSGEREVEGPAMIVPGQPDGSVTLHLGYGRSRVGRVGEGTGFDAYRLRTSTGMSLATGAELSRTGRTYRLVRTHGHHSIGNRAEDILHVLKAGETPAKPEKERVSLSLYPGWNYTDRYPLQHRWGMSIDMNACTGCSACVAACNAENNIAIVGKDQVYREREMHWLRIDTYYEGDKGNPQGPYFQPMLCQHCENAPCELVCPVEATTHSAEGINEMTYNRCVGTRYCSNNCPYKVRRFNFLQFADVSPLAELRHNPDVTVRQRGVMEKCTFCVQRANATRVDIKKLEGDLLHAESEEERHRLRQRMDERMRELQTACQQACPTEAIVFGDLNWRFTDGTRPAVVAEKERAGTYEVLPDLLTLPRVTYLPRIINDGRSA